MPNTCFVPFDIISKATETGVFVDSVKTKTDDNITKYEIIVKINNKDELDKYIMGLNAYRFIIKVER